MRHIWYDVLNEILEWHKETFAEDKCTHASQLLKLDEEMREMREEVAKGHSYSEEVVDVLIVSYVLSKRYNCEVGSFVFSTIEGMIRDQFPELYPLINSDLRKKLKVNKSRFWIFKDGKYHHVEEISNAVQ